MNRVLSAPHTAIIPGLLAPLKTGRSETEITERHTVRFELPLGPVEMSFLSPDQRLEPGTRVLVWMKGGGFVCASAKELMDEARREHSIIRSVDAARARLVVARQERIARDSVMSGFDLLSPQPATHRPEELLLVG